ncbi:hypothetical protein EMCRGX_G018275, partial [Ephydatia muelleri]
IMASDVPKLYCSWFCPYAQRAWIAFLEKGVDFEYVEVDPYNKTPEWLAINPNGLVPTIRHKGVSVWESPICVQYVDEAWTNDKHLLPTDPLERARVRMWSDHISKKVEPAFYRMLIKKSEEERTQAKDDLLNGLAAVVEAMDPKGPLFGGNQLGMVDIMLVPHAFRFATILPHYRGFSVEDSDKWRRYHVWYKAAIECESVRKTLPDTQKLIENYKRYADDETNSQVAQAIRGGTALP